MSALEHAEFTVTYLELAHYNNGSYASKTFSLDGVTKEEHAEEIQEWLDSLPTVHGNKCEEWRIGSTEGIPRCFVGEYDLDPKFFEFLEVIENTQADVEAVTAAVDLQIPLDKFSAAYYGKFETETELAYHYVDSHEVLAGIPTDVSRYFDYEAYGRDLALGDFWSHEGHYFRNHI